MLASTKLKKVTTLLSKKWKWKQKFEASYVFLFYKNHKIKEKKKKKLNSCVFSFAFFLSNKILSVEKEENFC